MVTVEVEEQSTGELSLGLGFSTTDGPLADINIRERNFLGRGQDLQLGTVVSFRSQQVDLSFTEPYFLDRNIAAGFDLFEIKTSPTTNFFTGVTPPYQQFSYGGALRAGYQITENLRQTLKYTARSDDITNIQSDASLFIALQAGNRIRPRRSARFCSTIAATTGLIRQAAISRLSAMTSPASVLASITSAPKSTLGYYYPVAPDWVLELDRRGRRHLRLERPTGAAAGPVLCRRRQSARLSGRRDRSARHRSPTMRSAARNICSAR